MKMTDKCKK